MYKLLLLGTLVGIGFGIVKKLKKIDKKQEPINAE